MSEAPKSLVRRGWGEVHQGRSLVYRPTTNEEAAHALADAAQRGLTVAHRGRGNSYGDLALNEGGALLETEALTGILTFDTEKGELRARAGTTVEELWKEAIPRGWWLPVVPGTMKVTLGGALAVNIHGKNNLAVGAIGEHVAAATLLTGSGEVRTVAGASLVGVVGGLGLSGTILDATLRLRRVHSGLLQVLTETTGSLPETLEALAEGAEAWEHAVGWIDCFAPGGRAGRSVLHFARDLPEDHARAGAALTVREQAPPVKHIGLALRALLNDPGLRALNIGRYAAGRLRRGHRTLEAHARFHFLLDYVPGWKGAYPNGLMQYQLFVPREAAAFVFSEALRLQAATGVRSYLGVLKRHRADPFPNSYLLDGFSLALDFPVREARLDRLVRLFRSFDAMLEEVGGRIYAAKDGVGLGALPEARDPLFSSNLVRRWERKR